MIGSTEMIALHVFTAVSSQEYISVTCIELDT